MSESLLPGCRTDGLQPFLHDLSICLAAPTVALSGPDGQLGPPGAQGVFSADVRVLSRAELTVVNVRGQSPSPVQVEWVSASPRGAATVEYIAVLRPLGEAGPDPTVWLRRLRQVRPDGVDEALTLVNASTAVLTVECRLTVGADLADIAVVKAGHAAHLGPANAPRPENDGLTFRSGPVSVALAATGATVRPADAGAILNWPLTVASRSESSVAWSLTVQDHGAAVVAARTAVGPLPFELAADDRRLAPFVTQSLSDIAALRMTTAAQPDDVFLAAGAPWYLTLFGRDSLWAARMLLPLGTELAAGTLRTLAARQGRTVNQDTAEEPGKILHEMRRPGGRHEGPSLPPLYYGTVDATPLWVCLLADARRWGLPDHEVAPLLPHAERALAWMVSYGDSDGDGFLEYVDASGRGLTNQGWKDSGDSVRFADGRIADGPVALAEVQGYAYQAALNGADLLDAFGRPGAQRWREYAAALAERFRESFWSADDLGPYPVLALDRDKAQVDSPASNMGHLLATGILSTEEAGQVARRLVDATMSSGFGLRTMSTTTGGYSPLSYHCGSVWPHDTAIALHGLLAAGFRDDAMELAAGLLAAGHAFGGRIPELYGGFPADEFPAPVPYPASCRPQAWSAASAIVLVQALLGLAVDVPAGVLTLAPNSAVGALTVCGLRVAGARLDVQVAADGQVKRVDYDGPLHVRVIPAAR